MENKLVEEFLNNQTMITREDGSFIYDFLIKLPDEGRMLDIGTGAGNSALFFAKVKPKWTIYTMDIFSILPHSEINKKWLPRPGLIPKTYIPSTEDAARIIEMWANAGAKNIIPIIANTRNIHWELELDALFIDGDHYYEGVKNDFDKFSPFVKKGGIIAFHDYALDAYYSQVNQFVNKEVRPKMKVRTKANVAIAHKR